jgi:hypothetical protein
MDSEALVAQYARFLPPPLRVVPWRAHPLATVQHDIIKLYALRGERAKCRILMLMLNV